MIDEKCCATCVNIKLFEIRGAYGQKVMAVCELDYCEKSGIDVCDKYYKNQKWSTDCVIYKEVIPNDTIHRCGCAD